ncbi:MAG: hypothetical protein COW88_00410 [Candidatus Lloydbacteria bacterium CG22_combo_CG10-13_8_21_14_all_47_15]|uniref:30S ribosomal protein S21 n=1 Tax=Candidatus Lloydbacteria bacterium CG22_combo_CG10-13_8_21_14_all_47_15 TaxID=1974635 RepID=A0A2H0CVN1_9BACT|nr:MAG: hypothetical protein COW88_00410 [Candidatus Lloydbacteria bacterium CG22_combo_CG10-13_8_21_14_all_47_15]
MAVSVEVTKSPNESTSSLVRRFTRRMQGSSILQTAKKRRYSQRKSSDFKKRKNALRRISRQKEVERLKKLGKLS